MQNIYAETKANLTAYLNGEKTPAKVPVYNMMNTSISGKGITDGKNNVFSTGYGFFVTELNDIENFEEDEMEDEDNEKIISLGDGFGKY